MSSSDKKKANNKAYYIKNKKRIAARAKIYCQKNKEKLAKGLRDWNIRNRKRVLENCNYKYKTDLNFRLKCNLRSRLYKLVRKKQKAGSALKDLGCTLQEFKIYIENKFQPGMTWENYGRYGWHLDHIKPLSKFDLSNRKQLLIACNYKNIQPLWAKDNISKGNKLI